MTEKMEAVWDPPPIPGVPILTPNFVLLGQELLDTACFLFCFFLWPQALMPHREFSSRTVKHATPLFISGCKELSLK